ncbi:MAG: hypothetical protein A3G18_03535 [Rhodospirillales bacterium RIFCSPLOWO2_12_FULL_58_28]|nr:MAG: hypothetical protein A3H92_01085 [Rhodospirillales bacterium RIFCSPLOWO2_02_FULL_58_16]OHC76837.1 MAG: hypothetical protein A3G18_03535 [Rhodospirillales bacterium RIFCSPLOWO2_12_FULL_58_28]
MNRQMMLKGPAVIFLLSVAATEAAAGSMGSAEAYSRLAAARDVFETNCAVCHGYDGAALVEGAPSFAKGERLEKKDAELLKTINDGKDPMPAWKDVISPTEQKAALAYARTITGGKAFADACAVCHAETLPKPKKAAKRMSDGGGLCEKTEAENSFSDTEYLAVAGFLTAWGKK